jgi:hypothetical protein
VIDKSRNGVHISYDDKLHLFAEHERKARKAKQGSG